MGENLRTVGYNTAYKCSTGSKIHLLWKHRQAVGVGGVVGTLKKVCRTGNIWDKFWKIYSPIQKMLNAYYMLASVMGARCPVGKKVPGPPSVCTHRIVNYQGPGVGRRMLLWQWSGCWETVSGSDVSSEGSHHLPRGQLGPVVLRGTDPEPSIVRPPPCKGLRRRTAHPPTIANRIPEVSLYTGPLGKEGGRGETIS